MGELGDVEQVVDDLAHHHAGVVAVVVREAQALVLLVQVAAHVCLHARAHDVPPGGDEVLAGGAHRVQRDEQREDPSQRREDGLRGLEQELLGEVIQELGERQVDAREHRRAHQIEPEQELERAVVPDEAAGDVAPGHARLSAALRLVGAVSARAARAGWTRAFRLFSHGDAATRRNRSS